MQDGPILPGNRMNDGNGPTFQQFLTLVLIFGFFVGADCFAIWLMR